MLSKRPRSLALRFVLMSLTALLLSACDSPEPVTDNSIILVTRTGPTTHYETLYGPSGFEYDMAQAYARYTNRSLKIVQANSIAEILTQLDSGAAHIGAAGLTATSDRARRYHFSPAYMNVNQLVLYRYGALRPRSVDKLKHGKLTILRGTSHEDTMNSLTTEHPSLSWSYAQSNEILGLMDSLRRGETDYIIVDSNDYDLYKSTFPGIGIAFTIKRNDKLVWMMGAKQDNALLASIDQFFEQITENGELESLVERHYGHISHMGRNDSRTFAKRVQHRLPTMEDLIKKIALEEGLDWRLLAAISYQESHWNPKAKSPTGVRGLMMLTKITAKEMGVTNRVDAEQSLRGGAGYLLKLKGRLSENIHEPDRSWMALAAYNVGFGHLEDARVLTEKLGGNPNHWMDVMEHLPLLRKREYYSQTRHGYARGEEPVTYVQRIRNYYTQLAWRDRNEDIMVAMAGSAGPTIR